jgi:hypothetical protein
MVTEVRLGVRQWKRDPKFSAKSSEMVEISISRRSGNKGFG